VTIHTYPDLPGKTTANSMAHQDNDLREPASRDLDRQDAALPQFS
jgi:hypothetical protein